MINKVGWTHYFKLYLIFLLSSWIFVNFYTHDIKNIIIRTIVIFGLLIFFNFLIMLFKYKPPNCVFNYFEDKGEIIVSIKVINDDYSYIHIDSMYIETNKNCYLVEVNIKHDIITFCESIYSN